MRAEKKKPEKEGAASSGLPAIMFASEAEWSRYGATIRLSHPPVGGTRVEFRHMADRPSRIIGILLAHARLEQIFVGNVLVWDERVYGAPPILFPGVVLTIKIVVVGSEQPAEVVIDLEGPEAFKKESVEP